MISLHILADNASPVVLERALLYLKRTKQRSVNIGAGAELQKGMQYVERVRAECPGIKIFWRNLEPEDTGIHTKMSPQSLFDKKVAPYLEWFKKNEIIMVCDNESSGDDNAMRRYAQWTVELLVIMHKHNLATAVCRFATGNIAEHQYQLLKPIFSAMLPSDWVSPNEYSNEPGKSSGGHLERYEQMWIAAGKPLPTTIGEAGLCPGYDPGKGFRSIRMSGKDHAKQVISEEIWYGDGEIDRFLYLVGGFGWEGFQLITEIGGGKVEADTLDALEEHYAKQVPTPPPPAPVDSWATGIAQTGLEGVIIRFQPDIASKSLAVIHNGDVVFYNRKGAVNGWFHVRKANVTGWSSEQFLKITGGELPAPNPDTKPIPLPPTPTQAELTLNRVGELWAERNLLAAKLATVEAELDDLLAA